jgi:hypothetical protein
MDGFSTLPNEVLSTIHALVFRSGGLRSALALEAASKQLRSTFRNHSRFQGPVEMRNLHLACGRQHGVVTRRQLAGLAAAERASPHSVSFWRWIAGNGRRLDHLVLPALRLTDLPFPLSLRDQPGVADARAVTAQAIVSTTLQPLAGLDNLVSLQYSPIQLRCPGVPVVQSYEDCVSNCRISYTRTPRVSTISMLPALEALVIGTPSVVTAGPGPNSLTILSSLTALTQLSLINLIDVSSLDFLTAGLCSRLQCVELCFLPLSSLAPVTRLTSLRTLFLGHFIDLDGGLAPLAALSHTLKCLQLGHVDCWRNQGLQPLTALRHMLEDLTIHGWMVLSGEVQAVVSQLTALTHLEVRVRTQDAPAYSTDSMCSDLEFLGPLSNLVSLHVQCTDAVETLAPVGALTALQDLELYNAASVSSLAPLSMLRALQRLKLQPVGPMVSSLEPLTALTGLQGLHLAGGQGVSDVAPLQHLTSSLQNLRLDGFPRIPQPVLRALQLPALS